MQGPPGKLLLPFGPSVGTGESFTAASQPGPGQQAALARALEPSRTEPLACPPPPSTGLRPGEQEGSGVKAGVCLLPPSLPEDHHPPDHWPSSPLITTPAVSQQWLPGDCCLVTVVVLALHPCLSPPHTCPFTATHSSLETSAPLAGTATLLSVFSTLQSVFYFGFWCLNFLPPIANTAALSPSSCFFYA